MNSLRPDGPQFQKADSTPRCLRSRCDELDIVLLACITSIRQKLECQRSHAQRLGGISLELGVRDDGKFYGGVSTFINFLGPSKVTFHLLRRSMPRRGRSRIGVV